MSAPTCCQVMFGLGTIGCLIGWIVVNSQQNYNNSTSLSVRSCYDICDFTYSYQSSYGYCCTFYSSYNCKSKDTCRYDNNVLYGNQKTILAIFFCLCLVITATIGCWKWARSNAQRRRQQQYYVFQGAGDVRNGAGVPQNAYRPPMQTNIQDRLPQSFIYRESKTACVVCLDPFNEGDKSMLLECGHVFHSKCIRDWVGKQANCPLCRTKV